MEYFALTPKEIPSRWQRTHQRPRLFRHWFQLVIFAVGATEWCSVLTDCSNSSILKLIHRVVRGRREAAASVRDFWSNAEHRTSDRSRPRIGNTKTTSITAEKIH